MLPLLRFLHQCYYQPVCCSLPINGDHHPHLNFCQMPSECLAGLATRPLIGWDQSMRLRLRPKVNWCLYEHLCYEFVLTSVKKRKKEQQQKKRTKWQGHTSAHLAESFWWQQHQALSPSLPRLLGFQYSTETTRHWKVKTKTAREPTNWTTPAL